jgi:hypothetical protein
MGSAIVLQKHRLSAIKHGVKRSLMAVRAALVAAAVGLGAYRACRAGVATARADGVDLLVQGAGPRHGQLDVRNVLAAAYQRIARGGELGGVRQGRCAAAGFGLECWERTANRPMSATFPRPARSVVITHHIANPIPTRDARNHRPSMTINLRERQPNKRRSRWDQRSQA